MKRIILKLFIIALIGPATLIETTVSQTLH